MKRMSKHLTVNNAPTNIGAWLAVGIVAALFIGWEFTSHFPAHKFIVSNRPAFIVVAVLVGLVGSAFARQAFLYAERVYREATPQHSRSSRPGFVGSRSSDHRSETVALTPSAAAIARLRWVAIAAPATFFVAWESITHFTLHTVILSEWAIFLLTVGVIAIGATAFTLFLFRLINQMQRQLVLQNHELTARTTALEALYEIGTGLSALQDVSAVKATAISRARELLGADAAGIALLDETTGEIRWELVVGLSSDAPMSFRLGPGRCVAGRAIQSGEAIVIEDIAQETEDPRIAYPVLAEHGLQAVLVAPVRIAGTPVGAFMVGHRTPHSFALGDLRLLTSLANQVAVAINNARMRDRLTALSALEERERIAREMHDGLAQLLGHLTARAAALDELLTQGKGSEARQQLTRLREVARDAYEDVRRSILGLRTHPMGQRGLMESLEEFVRRTTEQEGLPIHLETLQGTEAFEPPPAVEVQAIRIIQEAISNVLKHAHATEARVRLARNDDWFYITVEDDGEGFDTDAIDGAGSHYGLLTMRERAEGVGGHLSIESHLGTGTTVTAVMPASREE